MGIEWKSVVRGLGNAAGVPKVPAVRVTYHEKHHNLAFLFTRECLERYGWTAKTRLQIAVNYSEHGRSVLELLWRENPDCGYLLQRIDKGGNVEIKSKERRPEVIEKVRQSYGEWRHVKMDPDGVFWFGDLVNGKG